MKEGFTNFLSAMFPRMMELPGEISVYGKDLTTDEKWAYQAEIPLVAASVIKLPILVEAFRQARDGQLAMYETFSSVRSRKCPPAGR